MTPHQIEHKRRGQVGPIEVPTEVLAKWQQVADTLAGVLHVPSALIMRIRDADIEVFVSSQTADTPYRRGDSEHLVGSGLYCETVIKSGDRLLVPNAVANEHWRENPDIELGMISYLGYPILLPTGEPFGTLCVLDRREHSFSEIDERLLQGFKELIESHLALLVATKELETKHRELSEHLAEIQTLRGIIPICSHCKRTRDDRGYWEAVEVYITRHSEASFSHGLCPDCARKHYGAYAESDDPTPNDLE